MSVLNNVRYERTVTDPGKLPPCAAEVAFAGRSNAGKSSLLNAICGRRNLAHVSQVPGKTRTINVYNAGRGACIVDLPGYGFAVGPEDERAGWRYMIEGYLLGRPSLRMVFMLVDAKAGPTKLDLQMALWLQSSQIPYRVVINKSDKIPLPKHAERRKEIAEALEISADHVFWVSALKGTGIPELERAVAEALELI